MNRDHLFRRSYAALLAAILLIFTISFARHPVAQTVPDTAIDRLGKVLKAGVHDARKGLDLDWAMLSFMEH